MSSNGTSSSTNLDSQGLSGGYEDPSKNFGQRTFLAVLISIACYNAVEIVIVVLSVFKKYQGLYFWSMLMSSGVGMLIKVDFSNLPFILYKILIFESYS